jgi:hypothetical protein
MDTRITCEIGRYSTLWPVPLLIEIFTLKLLPMTTETAPSSRYVAAPLNARRIVWNCGAEPVNRLSILKLHFTK